MNSWTCQEPHCDGDIVCAQVDVTDGQYECGHHIWLWRGYCNRCAVVRRLPVLRCPQCCGLRPEGE